MRLIAGSIVQNPTNLQKGNATDAVQDKNGHLSSEEPVTWTGTQITYTQPIDLIIPSDAGDVAINRLPVAASPLSLNDDEALVVRINRNAGTNILAAGTYATLAVGEYAVVAVASLAAITVDRKDHFVWFRRYDTAAGLQLLYLPYHKQVMQPGQTVFLGASGSGSGTDTPQAPIPGYQWLEIDDFTALPASADSKITTTNYTNATFNIAKTLFQFSLDKSRTVATSSGTAFTINLAPGFTVAIGDIVYLTSGARSGQWRRIATVTNQTTFVLDAAFTGGDAAGGDTLMISQAVWTKDLVNLGSASEKTRARDQFSGNILQIAVDYFDSLTANDDIPDFVDTARVVMSASNEGLLADVGVPVSDTFGSPFVRAAYPATIDNYILFTNADQERLHLVFFPNPNNGSVTTTANLLKYEANFFADTSQINSGVLEDAICFSDNSTTPVNCTVSTPSGLTRVVLSWAYIPGINPGRPSGQVEVFVDGQHVSRFIGSAETPSTDLYWTEQTDGDGVYKVIQFNSDLSSIPIEIVVIKRFGVYDASDDNSAKITALNEIVVGSAAQVSAGIANYSALQDAHDAAVAGQKIKILRGTFAGASISKNIAIEGMGYGTVINSAMTFTGTSDFSSMVHLRMTSTLTLNAGANGCIITNFWINDASTDIVDNSTGSVIANFVEEV